MDAIFEIQVDPARHLMRLRLGGFFDAASVAALLAARQAAFGQLRCPINQHLALADVRAMRIQAQEMVGAFTSMLGNSATQSRRLAFVVAGTLARGQLQRALGTRVACCFTDPVEAERWVLSDEPAHRIAA